jgi:hypothetical protein
VSLEPASVLRRPPPHRKERGDDPLKDGCAGEGDALRTGQLGKKALVVVGRALRPRQAGAKLGEDALARLPRWWSRQ